MTLNVNKAPYHLSEKIFRRFENHIHEILLRYPLVLTINPAPWSPETFKGRLRDAMTSLSRYKWTSVCDVERLEQIRPFIVVTQNETSDLILVGPPDVLKGARLGSYPNTAVSPQITLTNPLQLDVIAIGHLLDRRILLGPISLEGCPREWIDMVVDRYTNIAVTEEGNKFILL